MSTVPFLFESERLAFREFSLDDAPALYRLNADPEVIRYTGDPPFASPHEALSFLLNYDAYRVDGYGRWAVISKDNREFLGWCGLKNTAGDVDLGYRFFRSAWGQGYATEAALACLDYGFRQLDMKRIIARVLPENTASCRVLEKAGMTFSGFGPCKGLEGARLYVIQRK
jgi:ribosomal-protein-alanine N-acetyltransferase